MARPSADEKEVLVIALTIVNARVRTDSTGITADVPVLITPAGILLPLLDYCLDRTHDRSPEWHRKMVKAVAMFVQYIAANPDEQDMLRLFTNFGQRLYTGTFERASGLDPAGICWEPKNPREAGNIVLRVTRFFDWLGSKESQPNLVNPKIVPSGFDRMLAQAAYSYRSERAMLGHTWAKPSATDAQKYVETRHFRALRQESAVPEQPPAFPEDRFLDLLFKGFKVGKRYDYRNMLITLLLHGAGFRPSEPFHLFLTDVVSDPLVPDSALVLAHHPVHGAVPSGDLKPGIRNRGDYLLKNWGLQPRNNLLTAQHAGWKGGAHERINGAYLFRAFWFAPQYGEMFWALWKRYLDGILEVERHTPFAFVNTFREPFGAPYTLGQYAKAHAAAVKRIGLEVSKARGTTRHGHRHAYGRRLSAAGVDPIVIKRVMHHTSIESQQVYTQASQDEVLAALVEATRRLKDGLTDRLADSAARVRAGLL